MRILNPSDSHPLFPSPEDFAKALEQTLPDFDWVEWVNSTGSTNADLLQRARALSSQAIRTSPGAWLLGAHLQTAGKGRAGRPWVNTAGSTLMFSCALTHNIPLPQLAGIAPALGVATCLALRTFFEASQPQVSLDDLKLKWPNDLLWRGAKLAGILIETAPQSRLIIGMGINMRDAQTLSAQLDRKIADIHQLLEDLGQPVLPSLPCALVAHIAQAWQRALDEYAVGGYAAFIERFDSVDGLAGQPVQVVDQGRILHEGFAQGTDAFGHLCVQTQTGSVPILVGDVSIRPIHSS